MPSSSSSLERAIDEYQDVSFENGGSYKSGEGGISSSSSSSSSNEHYSSGVPSIPLEEFQEMQRRMASGAGASLSRKPPSPLQDKEEEEKENVIYSCALEVASTLYAPKLKTLVDRYQIPREFKPRLPKEGEWCCSPSFGLEVYTSYLLVGLRFPLFIFYFFYFLVKVFSIGWVLDLTSLTPMVGG